MTPRTILFLGAAEFQTPPIHYARAAGYRVITCDNRPQNVGHALAHRSYDVSTLDVDGVRRIAEDEAIDGILAFGSDVSAATAAVVAAKLGLPGNPPESVEVLSRKHLFRDRLRVAGMATPTSASFASDEAGDAVAFARSIGGDVVIKPVDSSGSKGVSICSADGDLQAAVERARACSIRSLVVVEEHVPRHGYQICGDGWFQDGRIVFVQCGNGHFYDRPDRLAPYGESFPSAHPTEVLRDVTEELERALRVCGFTSGPFNLDVLIDARDRQPFIVEIGPRSGGNYLPSVIRYHTGVDLVAAAVESCISSRYRLDVGTRVSNGYHSCFMLHSMEPGTYRGFSLGPSVGARLLEQHPYIAVGAPFLPFVSSDRAIGNIILEFEDEATMLATMGDPARVVTLS